ncbi:snurportin-1 [Trichonephila inaurata madagascariensis]|uniref:Snurportin-1 n=1 Tax=Trichonephila inaurata madagascariensis TaxID=2747483 RepID=A0A8X6MI27_9ARAC|nr:snurportin-1 [Trichonephila inaurata madagascariensis]
MSPFLSVLQPRIVLIRVPFTMDELADQLANSQVTFQPNSTAAEHPRFAMYKAKSTCNQEFRRKKFLEAQKQKRYDYTRHARMLATSQWSDSADEQEEAEKDDKAEDMEYEEFFVKPPRSYANQLMLSEWLVEVPSDIEELWYLVLCPVGKRCLVVASRGYTKVFTKSGFRIMSFQSDIPGGNKTGSSPMHVYSLLDCIFDATSQTFYVLDVMCWNSHPCFDTETEFRFYWKSSKISEAPNLQELSRSNHYKFEDVPFFSCDPTTIKNTLWSEFPFPSKLDGLLFYHKKTHYTPGSTPLVGWLKGYMVPEMLGIEVPPSLEAEKPHSYVSIEQHIPEAFAKHAKRKEEEEKVMHSED